MSLADRLKALEDQQVITACKIRTIFTEIDEETASVLQRVLKGKLSNSAIARELTESGYIVGRTTVGLHRSGRCSCRFEK